MVRIVRALPLVALLLSAACKKVPETDSSVRGRMTDADTHQPIVGATISGRYIGGNAGFGPNFNTAELESVRTDGKGCFTLDFNARSDGSGRDVYRIGGSGNGYFGNGAEFSADAINNKVTDLELPCYRRVDFTIKVRHAGAANPDDALLLEVLYYPYGSSLSILGDGTVAERESSYFTVPTHPTVFSYRKRRNGTYGPQQVDSVMITQNGTEHVIEF